MKIHSYFTSGGKDLIREYLDSLTCSERAEGYFILEMLESKGISYLDTLNTRQIEGKVWEINLEDIIGFFIFYWIMIIYIFCMLAKNKKERLKNLS